MKSFYYRGKFYTTYKEVCRDYKVDLYEFLKRKRAGWSLEECLYGKYTKETEIINNKYEEELILHGIKYNTDAEICKVYSVPYSTYYNRKLKNWTLEERIFGRCKQQKVV